MTEEQGEVSRSYLRELQKELPMPVVLHMKHTRKLAEYILDRMREKGTCKLTKKSEKDVLSAIASHDFGKKFIRSSCIHLRYCKGAAERSEYYDHIAKACEYIEKNGTLGSEPDSSFDRCLYDCCKYHHEHMDGSGLFGLKGDEIPFSARLCSVVDTFDNYFCGGSGTSFKDAVAVIEGEMGNRLDKEICLCLIDDKEKLRIFADELIQSDKNVKNSRSGIEIKYTPIINVSDGKTVGFDVTPIFRDPYFGDVSPELFYSVAEQSELVLKLDKLMKHKVFRQMEQFDAHLVEYGYLRYSITEKCISKKGYAKSLLKLLRLYDTESARLRISIPESVAREAKDEAAINISELRSNGIMIAAYVLDEKESSFSVFEEPCVDEVILSQRLISRLATSVSAKSMIEAYIKVASRLGIAVCCCGVNSIETEAILQSMGATVCEGDLYGEAQTAYAVEKSLCDNRG